MGVGASVKVTDDEGASGGASANNPDNSQEFVVGFSLYSFKGDRVVPDFP